jgi:hypothetical protein
MGDNIKKWKLENEIGKCLWNLHTNDHMISFEISLIYIYIYSLFLLLLKLWMISVETKSLLYYPSCCMVVILTSNWQFFLKAKSLAKVMVRTSNDAKLLILQF